ncbi:MAG: hypothetical protein U1A78_05100 [Polyangia bacterium]
MRRARRQRCGVGLGLALGSVLLGAPARPARADADADDVRTPELRLPEPLPPEQPEPAPAAALTTAPPVAAAAPAPVPQAPPAPAVAAPASHLPLSLELAVLTSVHVQYRTYGFGGGLELGGRWQRGLFGLGLSLRLLYESYQRPEPAPSLLSLTLPVTLRIGRPRFWVRPYLGLGPQLLLQRVPEALGARPSLRSEYGATFYGLLGAQLSVRPASPRWGGPFVEVSYRYTIYNPTGFDYPAWNTAAVLLGYRLNTR